MRIPIKPYIFPTSPNLLSMLHDILNCIVHEILVSGPRDCAKTFQIWHAILTLCELYPGFQVMIARYEYSTMGVLYTQLEQKILLYRLDDRRNPFVFKSRTKTEPRPHILFDNGSKIVFVGMDKGDKVLGGEFDLFWYNEAQREFDEDKWTKVGGTMIDGRAGNWGEGRFLQIADINPTHKRHWLYLRAEEHKKMRHYRIKHKDHPLFYNWKRDEWLQKGVDAVNDLKAQNTPGTYEYMRMVDGIFCNAEGAVFPQFSYDKHVRAVDRKEIPDNAIWRVATDFGNNSSTAYYAETDTEHIRFKEIVRQGWGINQIVDAMKEIEKQYEIPYVSRVITDHEHNGRTVLEDAGYNVVPVDKTMGVKDGIDVVRKALVEKKLVFNANSLEHPDPNLNINCGADAMLALAYKAPEKMNGSKSDDLPDPKCFDHPTDEIRYYTTECIFKPKPTGIYSDSFGLI